MLLPARSRGPVVASEIASGVPAKNAEVRITGRLAILHVAQGGASHTHEIKPALIHPQINCTTTDLVKSKWAPSLSSKDIPSDFKAALSLQLITPDPENSSSQIRPSFAPLRARLNYFFSFFRISASLSRCCNTSVSPPAFLGMVV